MFTKETMDRIKLAIWDAFMLWASSIYIGLVIYFLEKYTDNLFSLLPLLVVSAIIFPFLSFLFYINRRIKKKYNRSED